MRPLDRTAIVLVASFALAFLSLLTSCGGGSTGNPVKPQFSSVISFGDSLSDVGSYVSATVDPQTGIAAGGHFTTNPGAIWIEDISATLGLAISPNVVGFGATQSSCAKSDTTPSSR